MFSGIIVVTQERKMIQLAMLQKILVGYATTKGHKGPQVWSMLPVCRMRCRLPELHNLELRSQLQK